MIYVSIALEPYPFSTVIGWLVALQKYELLKEEVLVHSHPLMTLPPSLSPVFPATPAEEIDWMARCRLWIGECDPQVRQKFQQLPAKPYALIPRSRQFAETLSLRQQHLAEEYAQQGTTILHSPAELAKFIRFSVVLSGMALPKASAVRLIYFGTVALFSFPRLLINQDADLMQQDFQDLCQPQDQDLQRVILDLSDTEKLDSSGLKVLVLCLEVIVSQGRDLVLWSVRQEVLERLSFANLNQFLVIEPLTQGFANYGARTEVDRALHPSLRGWQGGLKRALDLAIASVGLVLYATVWFLLWVIERRLPQVQTEIRCGWQGRLLRWRLLKPRRVGRKLFRRTRLERLPLFWNVLWGEISLVGCHAPILKEIMHQKFSPHGQGFYWGRSQPKPGIITSSYRGGQANDCPMWNLINEVQILLRALGRLIYRLTRTGSGRSPQHR
ncbi:MAG: STAS domain-containing protein [Oscillatoriales cyanobacterium SM2_2_1]|nr:STAS domain-containing protein [Oscillatoriales cyanobacterium SM2_2_1]